MKLVKRSQICNDIAERATVKKEPAGGPSNMSAASYAIVNIKKVPGKLFFFVFWKAKIILSFEGAGFSCLKIIPYKKEKKGGSGPELGAATLSDLYP